MGRKTKQGDQVYMGGGLLYAQLAAQRQATPAAENIVDED